MKKACFARGARKGFTLLEALFTVLIVAILAAVAVPLYSNTRTQAAKDTCLNNVRAIATAESKYKFDNGSYLDDASSPVASAGLLTYGLAEYPKCPLGDSYTVTTTSGVTTVKCSNATHTANKMDLK